jgi:hypothetical protein
MRVGNDVCILLGMRCARQMDGATPLCVASEKGMIGLVKALLDAGAAANQPRVSELFFIWPLLETRVCPCGVCVCVFLPRYANCPPPPHVVCAWKLSIVPPVATHGDMGDGGLGRVGKERGGMGRGGGVNHRGQ